MHREDSVMLPDGSERRSLASIIAELRASFTPEVNILSVSWTDDDGWFVEVRNTLA